MNDQRDLGGLSALITGATSGIHLTPAARRERRRIPAAMSSGT
jgi:hypothetical protein